MDAIEQAPAAVQALLERAEAAHASDVHLQMVNGSATVTFRLDGVMNALPPIPAPLAERVFGRIKYLARLKTYQESLPQDGRIDKADSGLKRDLRVSTYPTVTGEKIVIRLFSESQIVRIEELGFPANAQAEFTRAIRLSAGLVLLTGPAGSGKTTTIYAGLNEIALAGGRHIITVEDPVEQVIPGVMQTEINDALGLDFAKAAKHLLRQDPQVLVIGEIRDHETAAICLRAATTGHLMISTLHAGSCQEAIERLRNLCPDNASILHSLELIISQRLLRKLCAVCRGKKCDACFGTGYAGRIPVVEFFRCTPEIRAAVRKNEPITIAPAQSLRAAATELVNAGITDEREIERAMGPA